MPMGDEIAVLDGLDIGSLGMTPEGPSTGASAPARYVAPFTSRRRNVIDPSEGGTYGGGSSYAPGMPLLPSSVGLADADLVDYMRTTSVLPTKRNTIDPSGGALYGGGSSHAPGMPLTPSNAGLASLGRADRYADFNGLGRADRYADFSGGLDAVFDKMAGSSMTIMSSVGTGRSSPSRYVRPFVQVRRNVIDPSEGGTYGGGSNYAPGMPLLPSTIGLAELSVVDTLDQVPDRVFVPKLFENQRGAFKRLAGKDRLLAIKKKAILLARMAQKPGYMDALKRAQILQRAKQEAYALAKARRIRAGILGPRPMPVRNVMAPGLLDTVRGIGLPTSVSAA